MGHDQRFKEFLHAFLRDFLKLFFPRVEKRLDFQSTEFLDTEVFTELHDGRRREADVVAKLETRDGNPKRVLIHIEIQTRPERNLNERMAEYYSLLRSRYKLPIFPIVVYLHGGRTGPAIEEYREELWETEFLRFRYNGVWLARLNAEEYVERDPPAGAALAALMDRSDKSRRRDLASLRVSMLSRVVESGLDEGRQLLLIDLIETYFPLSAEQMESYQRLVSRKEHRKVQDVELTWAEKLMEKGRATGRAEGRAEGRETGLIDGKREALVSLLTAKFGPLTVGVTKRVESIDSLNTLDAMLERVLTATSLEEMKL